jgi:hypothetical protein
MTQNNLYPNGNPPAFIKDLLRLYFGRNILKWITNLSTLEKRDDATSEGVIDALDHQAQINNIVDDCMQGNIPSASLWP